MAALYGTIQGNRGEATRMGSKDSGFRSSCQSWEGSVITEMNYYKDDLEITIKLSRDSSSYSGNTVFRGSIEDLYDCFQLYKETTFNEN